MSEPDKESVQEAQSDQPDGETPVTPGIDDDQELPDSHAPGRADATGKEESLPLDQVFEILKNSRRRETLHYLKEHDGAVTLSELAEHIAAIENETTVQQITSSQRKRVYVGLYQCHLPKMDDMDVIDFDKNRGTIELGTNAEQVRSYLGNQGGSEWYKLYLSMAVVGTILFLSSVAGAAQYGLQPAVVLVVLLGCLFLGSFAQAMGFPQSGSNT